jgi:hypothetical protein
MMYRNYETPVYARPLFESESVRVVYVPVPMQAPTRSPNNVVRFMAWLLAAGLASFVITMAIMMLIAFSGGFG